VATRFYLPSSGTSPLDSLAVAGGWGGAGANFLRLPTSITKSDTAGVNLIGRIPSAETYSLCHAQFISAPLATAHDFTAEETASMVVSVQETSGSSNAFLAAVVRVVSGDGSTVRGTILDLRTDSGGVEWTTAYRTRIWGSLPLAVVSASAGDRIVIELGAYCLLPTVYTSDLGMTLRDVVATADFALTSNLSTLLCPWVELSPTLSFSGGEVPPAGPAFRSVAAVVGNTNVTSLAVAKPAGLAVGDLMIGWIAYNGDRPGYPNLPSGWTDITTVGTYGYSTVGRAFYKYADAADVAASTFTFTIPSTGAYPRATIIAFSGAVYDTHADAQNANDTPGTTLTVGTVTPAESDEMCVLLSSWYSSSSATWSTQAVATDNPTWTEDVDTMRLGVAHAVRSSSAATGNWTATLSEPLTWCGVAILLKTGETPPAGGTTLPLMTDHYSRMRRG